MDGMLDVHLLVAGLLVKFRTVEILGRYDFHRIIGEEFFCAFSIAACLRVAYALVEQLAGHVSEQHGGGGLFLSHPVH